MKRKQKVLLSNWKGKGRNLEGSWRMYLTAVKLAVGKVEAEMKSLGIELAESFLEL